MRYRSAHTIESIVYQTDDLFESTADRDQGQSDNGARSVELPYGYGANGLHTGVAASCFVVVADLALDVALCVVLLGDLVSLFLEVILDRVHLPDHVGDVVVQLVRGHREAGPVLRFWGPGAKPKLRALSINNIVIIIDICIYEMLQINT